MQIHLIIFITQLKSTSISNNNFYQRSRSNNSSSIIIEDDESNNSIKSYEIERLLNRRNTIIERVNYLIK